MVTKVEIIIGCIITLIVIVAAIFMYCYINKLNSTISDLNVTVAEQCNEIKTLHQNIDTLHTKIDAFKSTIVITSDFINNVEKIYNDEDDVRQAIYEEVLTNEETASWFNEKLPDDLIQIIKNRSAEGTCRN